MSYTLTTKTEVKTFDFTIEDGDGTTYHVPVLSQLPLDMLLRAREYAKDLDDKKEIDVIAFFGFLRDIFEPYAPGVVGSLSVEQAAILFKAYQDASSEEPDKEEPLGE